MKGLKYNSPKLFLLDPCLYNEDPIYLKIVTYFFFIRPKKYMDTAQAQNCFGANLLNFFPETHIHIHTLHD